jgi:hypothetical protein
MDRRSLPKFGEAPSSGAWRARLSSRRFEPAVTKTAGSSRILKEVRPAAALLWAGAGGVIGRLVEDERSRRIVNIVLAALVLLTVVNVWW